MPDVECLKCGKCCRESENIPPDFKDENGACIHLTEDSLCDIYEDRPLVCNWRAYYDFMSGIFQMKETEQEYMERNKQHCLGRI